jgi:hypothetical protein
VPRKGIATLIALVVGLSLTLAAYGGSASKKADSLVPKPTAATDRATVRKCLRSVGLKVVAGGKLPILAGSKALGVKIGGQRGNIMPGHLSAALFWYRSHARAESVMRNNTRRFPNYAMMSGSKILAAYDPAPSIALQGPINLCTEGLRP